ncbi:YigZ family protein [candidate division KSB1 bacterium]
MEDGGQRDTYRTVRAEESAEITVKKSRFTAFIRHIETVPEVEEYLASLRKRYHDATHHCYAYCIGRGDDQRERFHDDGEPSGTAGRPILTVLKSMELTDIICVVIRHYGGTKLGVGGLARAYTDAVQAAVGAATVVTQTAKKELGLEFPYELTGAVERHVAECADAVLHREFGESPRITCAVRESRIEDFKRQFRDITRDKGRIT